MWTIYFTKQAKKDARKAAGAGSKQKIRSMLEMIAEDPFRSPPPYERLVGDLAGAISRRINIQHRLVYQVIEEEKAVKILRMWTHYE